VTHRGLRGNPGGEGGLGVNPYCYPTLPQIHPSHRFIHRRAGPPPSWRLLYHPVFTQFHSQPGRPTPRLAPEAAFILHAVSFTDPPPPPPRRCSFPPFPSPTPPPPSWRVCSFPLETPLTSHNKQQRNAPERRHTKCRAGQHRPETHRYRKQG